MELSELLRHYEKQTDASISLEIRHPVFYHCKRLKLAPDQYLHHSELCRYFKMRDGNQSCGANKQRSIQIARLGRNFSGCCPHGIWEYACPIQLPESGRPILAAVLYLGNFLPADSVAPSLPGHLKPPPVITSERRRELRQAASFITDFVKIEFDWFTASGGMSGKQHREEFYLENCRRFIDCHYLENIALSDLADLLKVNSNYLGALIRQQSGETFRELLTSRRLAESQIYLKLHPRLSITKIARLCGFSDSNYFTSVFRRKFRFPPGEYRKQVTRQP